MIPRVALREALSDPNLLGTAIAGDSWRSWRALLIAAMGEELREDEREIFTKLTGREHEPLQRIDQFADQCVPMIAEPRDVGGDCRYCFGLSASSADHGGKLIDTLQRLALPAGQFGEDLALVLPELFAHRRNQERPPLDARDRDAGSAGPWSKPGCRAWRYRSRRRSPCAPQASLPARWWPRGGEPARA